MPRPAGQHCEMPSAPQQTCRKNQVNLTEFQGERAQKNGFWIPLARGINNLSKKDYYKKCTNLLFHEK
jgi:hypothetical protein